MKSGSSGLGSDIILPIIKQKQITGL